MTCLDARGPGNREPAPLGGQGPQCGKLAGSRSVYRRVAVL